MKNHLGPRLLKYAGAWKHLGVQTDASGLFRSIKEACEHGGLSLHPTRHAVHQYFCRLTRVLEAAVSWTWCFLALREDDNGGQ